MNLKFKNLEEKLLACMLVIVAICIPLYYADLNISALLKNLRHEARSISAIKEIITQKQTEIKPLMPLPVLLGRAEVSYAGGIQNRNSNIELGIAKIDGTRVAPGEEFSFLETLGPVLVENGFKEAKSFLNGEVILGLGGGLCHVSTTLFQSILQAGLPVTERHNHTFVVPFYKPGLDATISNLGPDFKFKNDTGYDIVIRGRTEDMKAIFEIYGVDDGRQASLSKPKLHAYSRLLPTRYVYNATLLPEQKICENTPTQGYTADIDYIVKYSDGRDQSTVFSSTYRPLERVCQVGIPNIAEFAGCTETALYSTVNGKKCPAVFSQ